jgi:hypothetical protein
LKKKPPELGLIKNPRRKISFSSDLALAKANPFVARRVEELRDSGITFEELLARCAGFEYLASLNNGRHRAQIDSIRTLRRNTDGRAKGPEARGKQQTAEAAKREALVDNAIEALYAISPAWAGKDLVSELLNLQASGQLQTDYSESTMVRLVEKLRPRHNRAARARAKLTLVSSSK